MAGLKTIARRPMLSVPIAALRQPVQDGLTRPLAWRLAQLARLENAILQREDAILAALAQDLGKPDVEAYFEVVAVLQELRLTRQHLKRWMAPQSFAVPLSLQPSGSQITSARLGCSDRGTAKLWGAIQRLRCWRVSRSSCRTATTSK